MLTNRTYRTAPADGSAIRRAAVGFVLSIALLMVAMVAIAAL
jgi:hypothetical protein